MKQKSKNIDLRETISVTLSPLQIETYLDRRATHVSGEDVLKELALSATFVFPALTNQFNDVLYVPGYVLQAFFLLCGILFFIRFVGKSVAWHVSGNSSEEILAEILGSARQKVREHITSSESLNFSARMRILGNALSSWLL